MRVSLAGVGMASVFKAQRISSFFQESRSVRWFDPCEPCLGCEQRPGQPQLWRVQETQVGLGGVASPESHESSTCRQASRGLGPRVLGWPSTAPSAGVTGLGVRGGEKEGLIENNHLLAEVASALAGGKGLKKEPGLPEEVVEDSSLTCANQSP